MPISGCHDLPLATFNLPSRVPSRLSPRQRAGTPPAQQEDEGTTPLICKIPLTGI